ncbi:MULTISPECIES: endonuclease/exonuclease/phosphatase family protein [unclassified Paenibacillus]|nr:MULTISPECIES: endonuclease/exonuclease/phosphatase family protein [unclassified Paenibacillus]
MTFNMHHGQGMDGKVNLNRIAEVIEESEADLVGLNEVDRCYSKRSGFMDQLSWLADRLHMNACFAASLTLSAKGNIRAGQYGNALLSRFPVISLEQHVLGNVRSGLREARVLLETIVQIHGHHIKLYVTHLSLNPIAHRQQVDFIVKTIMHDKQPVILMGDMNMRSGSKGWQKITKVLHDTCRLQYSYPCYTFPSIRPTIQLDYIFASKHFQITTAKVFKKKTIASDHLPLEAGLFLDL